MAYTLEQLSADIREALKADSGIAGKQAVCKLVSKVLLDQEFIAKHLTAEQCHPRKVLYEDPELGFCVCGHVYENAAHGAPHDHGSSWAIYGLAAGDTEMTDWRIVKKGEGAAPTLVEPAKTYVLKPGDSHFYDVGVVHSPKRDGLTKLVRIEGRNLDHVQRSNIKAAWGKGDTVKLDYVTIEKRGGIAVVRFDRKANLNAFNEKLVVELTHAARSFHEDLETHAVVLAGAPDAFSAGFDLKATDGWTSETDDLKRRQRAYGGVRLCKAWEAMPQITIAAMEKLAVGAGVAIALACDWRVLGRNAYLYVPEVKIGLNLQWGALPRLITLVGPARAKRITIMCEKMPASQALDWGLVEELADDGRTVEKALEMAEVVLSMPAPTVRMIKEAVNATANALHAATAFADADQSQLTAAFRSAKAARDSFRKK